MLSASSNLSVLRVVMLITAASCLNLEPLSNKSFYNYKYNSQLLGFCDFGQKSVLTLSILKLSITIKNTTLSTMTPDAE